MLVTLCDYDSSAVWSKQLSRVNEDDGNNLLHAALIALLQLESPFTAEPNEARTLFGRPERSK